MLIQQGLNMRQKLIRSRRQLMNRNPNRWTQDQVNRLFLLQLSIDELERDLFALVPEDMLEKNLNNHN